MSELDACGERRFAARRPYHCIAKENSHFRRGRGFEDAVRSSENGDAQDSLSNGQQVFNRLADLKIPTVAAIHGASLAAVTKVALACDYRVASDEPAPNGLPRNEPGPSSRLGPAARDCREVIGAEKAAEGFLRQTYSAQEALKWGCGRNRRRAISFSMAHVKNCAAGKTQNEGGAPSTPGRKSSPLQNQRRKSSARTRALQNHAIKLMSISPDESCELELDDCGAWQNASRRKT